MGAPVWHAFAFGFKNKSYIFAYNKFLAIDHQLLK